METDEKDIGVTPAGAALGALGERMEKEKQAIDEAIAPIRQAAYTAAKAELRSVAADRYAEIGAAYRAGGFFHEAKEYEERAANYRKPANRLIGKSARRR